MKRFRTQYDEKYNPDVFAAEIGEDEGLVQQHMKDECDINVIMARYQATGELQHVSALAGEYGDYSNVVDYKSGLEQIMAAEGLFMELPSKIRDRFRNDPGEFVEFAMDKENLEQMREWGLAPKPDLSVPAPNPEANQTKGGARTSGAKATPEGGEAS